MSDTVSGCRVTKFTHSTVTLAATGLVVTKGHAWRSGTVKGNHACKVEVLRVGWDGSS